MTDPGEVTAGAAVDGIDGSVSSSAAGSSGAYPANYGSSCSDERGERFRGERGVEWCEEFMLGRPAYIAVTVRPRGVGRRLQQGWYRGLSAWVR